MEKMTWEAILQAAAQKKGKQGWEFSDKNPATILIGREGSAYPIDEINRIETEEGFMILNSTKGDTYYLGYEQIIGLRLRHNKKEGAGFVAP